MDIVENIKQTLREHTLLETTNIFYFVPTSTIIEIYEDLNTAFYGAMVQEEDAWDGSDLNLQISI